MGDVHFQGEKDGEAADALSEGNLGEWFAVRQHRNYFDRGCSVDTPDYSTGNVTVNAGKAYTEHADQLFAAILDQETLAFESTTGENYLYATFDPLTQDSATWELVDTMSDVPDPKLLRATIDAGAQTVELNQPAAEFNRPIGTAADPVPGTSHYESLNADKTQIGEARKEVTVITGFDEDTDSGTNLSLDIQNISIGAGEEAELVVIAEGSGGFGVSANLRFNGDAGTKYDYTVASGGTLTETTGGTELPFTVRDQPANRYRFTIASNGDFTTVKQVAGTRGGNDTLFEGGFRENTITSVQITASANLTGRAYLKPITDQ